MKPPIALSSVDLPQPEGPSSTKRSASCRSKLTRWVARTTRSRVRYSRLTPSTCSSGAPAVALRSVAAGCAAGPGRAKAGPARSIVVVMGSVPRRVLGVVEEIVLHRRRLVLDGADAVHELGQRVGVLRRGLELDLRVLDDPDQQVAVDPGVA